MYWKGGDFMSDQSTGASWFADLIGDGTGLAEQLGQIKEFAYAAFDRLDLDGNGYMSQAELEEALKASNIGEKEKSFLSFLLDNHDQIAEANEDAGSDGISRSDLESYFELIATLL